VQDIAIETLTIGLVRLFGGNMDRCWEDGNVHTSSRLLCFLRVSMAGLALGTLILELVTGDSGGL
jgi:hypothetical protein